MGALKNYNVGGLDVLGNGKPAPADTVLRLDDATAEKLGLKGKAAGDEPAAKPRRASTRKRQAPAAAKAPAKKAASARKRG